MDRLAQREPEPRGRLMAGVARRAQLAVFAQHQPDEARAVLGVARSLRPPTAAGKLCFDRLGFIGGAAEDRHR